METLRAPAPQGTIPRSSDHNRGRQNSVEAGTCAPLNALGPVSVWLACQPESHPLQGCDVVALIGTCKEQARAPVLKMVLRRSWAPGQRIVGVVRDLRPERGHDAGILPSGCGGKTERGRARCCPFANRFSSPLANMASNVSLRTSRAATGSRAEGAKKQGRSGKGMKYLLQVLKVIGRPRSP